MMNTIFPVALVVFCAISVFWGIVRGLPKARLRAILVILSAVLAVVSTVVVKQVLNDPAIVEQSMIPVISQAAGVDVSEYTSISARLTYGALGFAGAVAAPLLFVIFFMIYSLVTWIVFAVVCLVFRPIMKRSACHAPFRGLRAGLWIAVQTVVIAAVYLVPISVYSSMGVSLIGTVEKTGAVDVSQIKTISDDYIVPLNDSAPMSVFRACGGDALIEYLTSFEVDGEKTDLNNEVSVIADLAIQVSDITKAGGLESYGEKEAEIIRSVTATYGNSKLASVAVSDLFYEASDAWLKGEAFLGMEKPLINPTIDPMIDSILNILNKDAKQSATMQMDVRTTGQIVAIMAEKGVLANAADTNQLLTVLSESGAIGEMIEALGSNPSMSVLIPEITNLGIRAIATTLGIPEDTAEVYDTFLADVSAALNEAKELPEEEQHAFVVERLSTAFDEAGVEVDEELLDCYTASMIKDMVNIDLLTSEADVQAFFNVYSQTMEGENTAARPGFTEAISEKKDPYAGTIYEGMTRAQMAKTGAGALANVTKKLSELASDDVELKEKAAAVLSEVYTELLGEGNTSMERIQTIEYTAEKATSGAAAIMSLTSSETMQTTKVTLAVILIDTTNAGPMTEEQVKKEAANMQEMFSTATELIAAATSGDENVDLDAIVAPLGKILNNLSTSETVGGEKTASLMTAVLQSEQVRDTADLDMKTATQLAQKATEGDVDYEKTLGVISGGVNMMNSMNNGTLTDEQLVDMIRNITPQSAGMIQVYVTPERMHTYGVPEQNSGLAASMVGDVFEYLAEDADTDFDKEAAAINQMINIAMAAKEDSEEGEKKPLFNGILPSADETVEIFMSSKSVAYSLKKNLTDGEKVTVVDPFGIAGKIKDGAEKEELMTAVDKYVETHADVDMLELEALLAMFGMTMADMPA